MPKLITIILFVFSVLVCHAQIDSTSTVVDLKKALQDTTVLQDTVKKETKVERKAREKAEKERAKFYYKNILKDSARLQIEHVSDVAWKRSAILPGWGQITNGGYLWIKLPIIYGGFITAYFVFDYWNWYYQKFTKEAAFRINNNGEKSDPDLANGYTLEGLIRQKDNFRRYRDMTILVTAVWWAGNVVEAYTDSMLRNRYNIGDDLSIKINPTLLPSAGLAYQASFANQFTPGVKLTFNF